MNSRNKLTVDPRVVSQVAAADQLFDEVPSGLFNRMGNFLRSNKLTVDPRVVSQVAAADQLFDEVPTWLITMLGTNTTTGLKNQACGFFI